MLPQSPLRWRSGPGWVTAVRASEAKPDQMRLPRRLIGKVRLAAVGQSRDQGCRQPTARACNRTPRRSTRSRYGQHAADRGNSAGSWTAGCRTRGVNRSLPICVQKPFLLYAVHQCHRPISRAMSPTRPSVIPLAARRGLRLVHFAESRNPVQPVSHGERPPLHGPAERLGHGLVEVGDERLDPLLEVRLGGEVATAEQLAHQNGEPDLDLIDP